VSVLVIQNAADDPPGRLLSVLEDPRILRPYLGDDMPDRVPADVRGVVALGGSMGALDDGIAPWLPAERSLLRDAVERGVPVLGLCLGHQLLAAATGGTIRRAARPEFGVHHVTHLLPDDPLMAALPGADIPALQCHQDEVGALPEGAVPLLTSAGCAVQAFRLGDVAYGLQMHPESTAETFATWSTDGSIPRSVPDPAAVVADVQAQEEILAGIWLPVLEQWNRLVTHD
jgi:GMP synthase (glutamine-hydrolysing)